jgi:hypothetical protein
MAHVLITHSKRVDSYTPIASIKKYKEPDFEKKLYRYAKSIFSNYHVFSFKFGLSCSSIPGKQFEPDLLLVSKSFKKWVIVEVELCKPPTQHTLDQIECFSKPIYNPAEIVKYLRTGSKIFPAQANSFLKCFSNYPPDLIVVLDDYSDAVFEKFHAFKKQLKICVLEVYKKAGYTYEGYRFGGDYPYELTNSSKLEHVDDQHFKILKRDFARDLPANFEVKFDMEPFDASIIKPSNKTTYLKLPYHNIPSDVYLQLGKTLRNEYVIQKL